VTGKGVTGKDVTGKGVTGKDVTGKDVTGKGVTIRQVSHSQRPGAVEIDSTIETGRTVDLFAQDIDMTGMPGSLLDHVDVDPAQ
jgi:hypothetical protein